MRFAPVAAGFLAVLMAGPVLAEGASDALSYTWTGLYGGINGGYGWGKSDWDFGSASGSTSQNIKNGVVGLQVGYDAQLNGNLFAGIEASLDAASLNGKGGCGALTNCETHVTSLGDVSARLGVTSGRGLFYVKGGVAYEDANHHIETPGVDNRDDGGAAYGWLLGGGAEYALMYNLTAKLEYNYMDFGSNSYTIAPATPVDAKQTISLVKFGMNLKFD